jgi:hypothetical protein
MIFWYILLFKWLLMFPLPQSLSLESMGCLVGIVARLQTGSSPGRGKKFFLFPKTSTPALGPTQLPVQWVPVFFSCPDLKWMRHEFDIYLQSSAKVKYVWSCTSDPPICLRDMVSDNFIPLTVSIISYTGCSFESGTRRIFKFWRKCGSCLICTKREAVNTALSYYNNIICFYLKFLHVSTSACHHQVCFYIKINNILIIKSSYV